MYMCMYMMAKYNFVKINTFSYHRWRIVRTLVCNQLRLLSCDGQLVRNNNCWKCGQQLISNVMLLCHNCHSIQAIEENVNYFNLFDQNISFNINLIDLSKTYKSLQMTTHPDKYVKASQTEHIYSMDNSSLINKAYKTLREPYERGLYLVKLSDNHISESHTHMDSQFLTDIMKINEDIDENVNSKNKLLEILKTNENNMNDVIKEISLAFSNIMLTNLRCIEFSDQSVSKAIFLNASKPRNQPILWIHLCE
ncbi:co-chaperone protein HscB homolog [Oppia nitens]|uniref:co-chaperone protein HscB homolog n=1 Tax=Oppia nitens TaxID=1686743 RepID=UPI0023DAEA71|nr:co-chaperone protein HscB homolog [Oppia nitens]